MLPNLLSKICPGGRYGVRFFNSVYSRNTSACGCKFSSPIFQRSLFMRIPMDKMCAMYTGKYLFIGVRGVSSSVPGLHMKKRPQRKKKTLTEDAESHSGFWTVTAYATAEEYDLEKLEEGLRQQNLYAPFFVMNNGDQSSKSGGSDVLRAKAKYQFDDEPREIFFFREGSVVLWNISELECTNILNFLRKFEENSYSEPIISEECETMKYTYSNQIEKACLQDEVILLNSLDEAGFEKYTFSNAVGLSVKLGVLEASLDCYIDSVRSVTEDLRQGKHIRMSREEVLRKIGQLFALRHMINLSSDLLDTPDFYWDREDLENLYHKMCLYFSIAKRTRVMNEKLNHCMELVELLSSHLNDRHHIRLEWMIIILIMVEVLFEIVHYAERILG
ncbi:required for meiotic nuclear division protein 1 homolog [Ischnura elegans]|uniref:required for meiotic nuclear division protein 1 homolog n=1 Tax=Ischnura elegans TaxID=197161 RepID=UPI001ED8AD62|nr:required for meiotic nuclear division protein 1 homolog [Ischnura elegans]